MKIRPVKTHVLKTWPAEFEADRAKWTPSLLMPRWASRITLEVTEVRVERLQSITEADAIAEGVEAGRVGSAKFTARDVYAILWDTLHGKAAPWASSPPVWVLSFRRVA